MALSYSSGPSTTPLLGITIGRQLEQTTARAPDALAVVSRHQDQRLTYAQLSDRVEVCARALLEVVVH
jgi:fatty-acyl-CoA synthase